MALSPFFGRGSIFHDYIPATVWDHVASLKALADTEHISSYAKDVQALFNTRIDWKETEDAHVISVDLPGVKKEEVKVEVVDKTLLKISGERHKEEVKATDIWHAVERASGKFMRSFRLPGNVDTDSINAKFNDGVLILTVPKVKAKTPNVKCIDICQSEPAAKH